MTDLAQILWSSLVSGLVLAVVASGFALIFRTNKVFHLAHGVSFATGGLVLWYVQGATGSLFLGTISGLVAVALLGAAMEATVYSPMVKRRSNQALTMVASIAVYMIVVNALALTFGNGANILDLGLGSVQLGSVTMPVIQTVQVAVCAILLCSVVIFMTTKAALPLRALAGAPVPAQLLGVRSSRTRLLAIAAGSVLAAVGGMLKVVDTGLNPSSGMTITLSAAVATILGGERSSVGPVLAALLIALLQTTTEWFLSAQWKEGVTFLLLIGVLLWRTEGIMSYRMRVDER